MPTEVELSQDQLDRLYQINDAVYQCLLVLLNKTENEFPWDMYYIGEATDLLVEFLARNGHHVYRPAVVTNADGSQYIEEYES